MKKILLALTLIICGCDEPKDAVNFQWMGPASGEDSPELTNEQYQQLINWSNEHLLSKPLIKEALTDNKMTFYECNQIVRETLILELKKE